MKERPILFSAPMVRAIIDGRKTQTRRVVNFPADWKRHGIEHDDLDKSGFWNCGQGMHCGSKVGHRWQYGDEFLPRQNYQTGDRLWVRETWAPVNNFGIEAITYRSDGDVWNVPKDDDFNFIPPVPDNWCFALWYPDLISGEEKGWKSSIHMPKWASRITLGITDVRVERLQQITEDSAQAEGARWVDFRTDYYGNQLSGWSMEDPFPDHFAKCLYTARMAFANYINKIHGGKDWNMKPTNLWYQNPWVWVIEFKRV